MEAKDTVMDDRQLEEYHGVTINTHIPQGQKRLAQAEISFKAGMGEVVEWAHKKGTVTRNRKKLWVPYLEWLAQLKEWGL